MILNENFRNLDMSPLLQLSHLICAYAYTHIVHYDITDAKSIGSCMWHHWNYMHKLTVRVFPFWSLTAFGHIHFHCMAKSRVNGLPNICFIMRVNNDRIVIFWVSLLTFLHSHMSMSAFLHWQTQSLLVTCLWTPSLWAQWTWAGYF